MFALEFDGRQIVGKATSATLIALVACTGDPPPGIDREPISSQPPAVASVEVQSQAATVPWGFFTSVTAVAKDAAGRVLSDRVATWTSSNPAVIQVMPFQGEGRLAAAAWAFGVGEVTVTATVEGKSGEAKITATLPSNPAIKVWPDTSRIPLESRRTLHVRRFSGVNRPPLTVAAGMSWESSDPSVAAVDDAGTITAVGEGHATITATFQDQRLSGDVFVFRYASSLEFASVTAGDRHACGLTTPGVAYCWGDNDYGQLGRHAPMDRCARYITAGGGFASPRYYRCSEAPVRVDTDLRFTSISAGLRQTCAVTSSGVAYCWGRNVDGATGTGVADTIVRTPTRVAGGLTFRGIDVGDAGQVCGITTSNAAYCWGDNGAGALGNGSDADSPTPVAVAGGHTWRAIRAGRTACAITTDNVPYCWGSNSSGQVGVAAGSAGCVSSSCPSPTRVSGDLRLTQIASSCGLTGDGAAYCWGYIWGGVISHTPTAITGGLSFATLSRSYRCGVAVDGFAHCWWSPPGVDVPVRGTPEFRVRTIDIGGEVGCAIDGNGIAFWWDTGAAGNNFWAADFPSLGARSGTAVRIGGQ